MRRPALSGGGFIMHPFGPGRVQMLLLVTAAPDAAAHHRLVVVGSPCYRHRNATIRPDYGAPPPCHCPDVRPRLTSPPC